ncbi:beta-lactamase family protein [Hymenobacter sp. DH14]|uniref:Beta-lactamase family protein n=1 Tax=Hymenobacter cyanobacteriorum TaxID=2926463 RepID=A0A9X1VHU5_9BACT|nr:serine hydrolase domain-containing protein [Hymenobacter cyanobacteriorum]MCI1188552.1 beta-lactamase family protein [Hymenobacter cyanobacteriorum]
MKNLFLLLLMLLCGRASYAQAPPTTATLTALMQKAGVPGMQLVYAHGGRVRAYALGQRTAGQPAAVDATTTFEAASLGKAVLAYVALRLVDRGVLTLDKPLLAYAPYPRLQGAANADRITARMVLGHTTGLPNWATNPLSPEWPTTPLRLKYAPDSCWNYSGEGYVFLQKTLEHLTGKPFETLAREEVFQPLRMKHSGFAWQKKFAANAASGHDGQRQPVAISHFPAAYGAFSLLSTAADYSRFLQAVMTGQGLKPATALLLRTPANEARRCGQPATATDPFIAWACGVGLATTSRGLAQWQWGDNGNFKGFYLTLPGTQESLVFLTNSSNGPKMADELLHLFFGPGEYSALQWLAE